MLNILNGKIYIIKSLETEKVYIGSTCLSLNDRFSMHKSKYKKYTNGKGNYLTSFNILKFEDAYIELLENIQDITHQDLLQKEGDYIRKNKSCVNKNIAGRTHKQYYIDNIEKTRKYYIDNIERIKTYYINNRDKLSQKISCDCSGTYRVDCKFKHLNTIKHQKYMNYKNKILTDNIETTCQDIQKQEQQAEDVW